MTLSISPSRNTERIGVIPHDGGYIVDDGTVPWPLVNVPAMVESFHILVSVKQTEVIGFPDLWGGVVLDSIGGIQATITRGSWYDGNGLTISAEAPYAPEALLPPYNGFI